METRQKTFVQEFNGKAYHITQDPDAEPIQNNPELALLALQLRQSSPTIVIDLDHRFRATLREKLQDIVQSNQLCPSSTLPSSQNGSKHVTLDIEDFFSYIVHNIARLLEKRGNML